MLVDAEHAFDAAYSKSLGVDVENLIVCQPDNGEMALESKILYSKLLIITSLSYFCIYWRSIGGVHLCLKFSFISHT